MSDRQIATRAHDRLMALLFEHDSNPTYELARVTLEQYFTMDEITLMALYRLIRHAGVNHNGLDIYQVRGVTP